MDIGLDAKRRLLLAVDAKGYGGRDDLAQFDLQGALMKVLERAAARAGLNRQEWLRQVAGDGELAVLPESETESLVVDDFVRHLSVALDEHNHDLVERARLRLRVVIHHGPVAKAAAGFAGQAVVTVSRVLESDALRSVLSAVPRANLVVALTARIFEETVAQRHTGLRSADFRRLEVEKKEFVDEVWLYIPGVDIHAVDLTPVTAPAFARGGGQPPQDGTPLRPPEPPDVPPTAGGAATQQVTQHISTADTVVGIVNH